MTIESGQVVIVLVQKEQVSDFYSNTLFELSIYYYYKIRKPFSFH